MTNRERMLAILDGKSPDRIPWIPRPELWYTANRLAGTLPSEYRDMSLGEIARDLRIGASARTGRVYTTRHPGVETTARNEGLLSTIEYRTPVGTVTEVTRRTADLDRVGLPALVVEHMLKRPEDYDVVTYMLEKTEYYPCYEEFEAYDRDIGDDGLPMVAVGDVPSHGWLHGLAGDVPFHGWLQGLVGYEKGYIDLFDYPDKVERLLETMTQVFKERMWSVVANSPARLLLHGMHLASQTTPPNYFERYITPYAREFNDYMHQHGKSVAQHADNDVTDILDHLMDARWDMQETFVTHPMVPCTLKQAREKWGANMIIWGGVPSAILEEYYPEEDFEAYMDDLFRTIAPGDAFILGIADNMMPTSMLSRVKRITELVEEKGRYPIPA